MFSVLMIKNGIQIMLQKASSCSSCSRSPTIGWYKTNTYPVWILFETGVWSGSRFGSSVCKLFIRCSSEDLNLGRCFAFALRIPCYYVSVWFIYLQDKFVRFVPVLHWRISHVYSLWGMTYNMMGSILQFSPSSLKICSKNHLDKRNKSLTRLHRSRTFVELRIALHNNPFQLLQQYNI